MRLKMERKWLEGDFSCISTAQDLNFSHTDSLFLFLFLKHKNNIIRILSLITAIYILFTRVLNSSSSSYYLFFSSSTSSNAAAAYSLYIFLCCWKKKQVLDVESKNYIAFHKTCFVYSMYTSMTPIFLYIHRALLSIRYIHSAAVFDSPFSRAHKNAQNRLNRQSVKKCFSLAPKNIIFSLSLTYSLFIFFHRPSLIIFFFLHIKKVNCVHISGKKFYLF